MQPQQHHQRCEAAVLQFDWQWNGVQTSRRKPNQPPGRMLRQEKDMQPLRRHSGVMGPHFGSTWPLASPKCPGCGSTFAGPSVLAWQPRHLCVEAAYSALSDLKGSAIPSNSKCSLINGRSSSLNSLIQRTGTSGCAVVCCCFGGGSQSSSGA